MGERIRLALRAPVIGGLFALVLGALALWEGYCRLAEWPALVPTPAGAPAAVLPSGEPTTASPATASPADPDAWRRWVYLPVAKDSNLRPRLSSAAAILVEPSTMTVLYAHNEHQRRAPASTTKIMTALLALERGRLQDVVTVSRRAAATPGSTIHLRAGQTITLGDLVQGLLLRSGNDAAVAIAEHLAGSVEAFAQMMNRRARELGALNSRFQNPHGLDQPDHFSSAFDLAHLSRLAMALPTFKEAVGRQVYEPGGTGQRWQNTNRLLWSLEGAEGIKTGTTGRAGNCLVAAASRDGMRLISVVLHSGDRWADSRRLLEWGFAEFHLMTAAPRGVPVARAALPRGVGELEAVPLADLSFVVHDKEVGRTTMQAELAPLAAPVRKGQRVGWVRALVDGEVRREVPLVAGNDVLRWTPLRALWYRITRYRLSQ